MTEFNNATPTFIVTASYCNPDGLRNFPGTRDQHPGPANRDVFANACPAYRDTTPSHHTQSHALAAGPKF